MNKNINPITKRTIKVNGPVYNNIEKNCNKKNFDNKPKRSKNICDEWLNNPNINPETGKSIKKNGPIYKKSLKLCNEKKSKSTSKSDKSSNVSTKTKRLSSDWLNNPSINPETGRKIKIDGPKFKYFKSLCMNMDKKIKSPSLSLSKSTSKYYSIPSVVKSKSNSYHSVKSSPSPSTSISSITDDELKKLFDKDKKLKDSVFNKLKKLKEIKKTSSTSFKSLLKSPSPSPSSPSPPSSKSSTSSKSSIINPYFYHNDDYKRKKSSEEISLENEIFKEIKTSISSSSTSSIKSNNSKDGKKDKMEEGFLGKLFNMFGI